MASLELEHIYKIYPNGYVGVEDFDLKIADGEFLILVGPSGCGKSTTMRMVAGLESISKGSIKIGDKVVNNLPPRDRDIAMVFQDYALYPHMTVAENLSLGLRLRKTPKSEIAERTAAAAKVPASKNNWRVSRVNFLAGSGSASQMTLGSRFDFDNFNGLIGDFIFFNQV